MSPATSLALGPPRADDPAATRGPRAYPRGARVVATLVAGPAFLAHVVVGGAAVGAALTLHVGGALDEPGLSAPLIALGTALVVGLGASMTLAFSGLGLVRGALPLAFTLAAIPGALLATLFGGETIPVWLASDGALDWWAGPAATAVACLAAASAVATNTLLGHVATARLAPVGSAPAPTETPVL